MKNKRGFTLIEVLAVIVVLAIIITIAVPAISMLIKKQRKNYYEAEDQNVKLATQDYFNTNRNLRPTGVYGRVTVDLGTLVGDDFIDQVVDADDKKSCSGYGMAVNTGNKNYEYYTCIKCNCDNANNNCEYVTDTTKIYNTAANLCTDDYNPVAILKTPGTLYLYNGRSDLYNPGKLVSKVYINLNNQNIDWKVSVSASNISDININQSKKYILNYSYENSENEISKIEATSDFIVYKYNAPNVDTKGFSWGNTVKDTLKFKLSPNGIDVPEVTPPNFTVDHYEVSYAPIGTEEWSTYDKIASCDIDDNICDDGTLNISSLTNGTYKLKFRFVDTTQKNYSYETSGNFTFKIEAELSCPKITANVTAKTWVNQDVDLSIKLNDTFDTWEISTNTNGGDYTIRGTNDVVNPTATEIRTLTGEGKIKAKVTIYNKATPSTKKDCYSGEYWIDKTAPTCTNVAKIGDVNGANYTNNKWVNKNVYTSANCKDTLSGCSNEKKVTTTGKTTNGTYDPRTSWTVYAEGTSYLDWSVKDNAGNTKACSRITVKVDKTPPEIYYKYDVGACCVSAADNNITSIINYRAEDSLSGVALIQTKHCYDMGTNDSESWYCAHTDLDERAYYIRKNISDNPQSTYKDHLNLRDTGKVKWLIGAADAAGNTVSKKFNMTNTKCDEYEGECGDISCPTINCP